MPVDCEWTFNSVHPPSLPCWFVCGFEGLGIWSSLQCTCSHFKHETDWLSGEKLTAWNDVTCNQYATEPVTHDTVVCDFHDAVFIWKHTHRSVCHLFTIFSIASWCLFRISLLCSAFLKYFLSLSPPSYICLFLEIFCPFYFFSFPPFLSSPPPCVVSITPVPPHRYLTPRFKTEFYDVTKWVEDVNKNTQGPYLRYNLRPCPVPHTLV